MPKKGPFDLPPGFLDAIRAIEKNAAIDSPLLESVKLIAQATEASGLLGYGGILQAIKDSQLAYASQLSGLMSTGERFDHLQSELAAFDKSSLLAGAFAAGERFDHLQSELGILGGKLTAFHDSWRDQLLTQAHSMHDIAGRWSSMIELTEGSLARFDMLQPGALLGLDHQRHTLEATMKSLTASFALIYDEASTPLISLPRFVVERPPQEVFLHVAGVEIISSEQAKDTEAAETEALWTETEAALPRMLDRFGSDLVRKWQGAREALASRNPDRIAHVSVSIREVFRIVLHTVAPDDAIRSWSTCKDDFDKGRPTRRARFRYATRNIDHPPFSAFLAKDFSAALELLTLFDEGVHAARPDLSEHQVRLMTLRMGQFLRFLIEVTDDFED